MNIYDVFSLGGSKTGETLTHHLIVSDMSLQQLLFAWNTGGHTIVQRVSGFNGTYKRASEFGLNVDHVVSVVPRPDLELS